MDVLSAAFTLLLVTLLTPLVKRLAKYALVRYRFRNIDGPRGYPIFGNLPQLGKDSHTHFSQIRKWSRKYRDQGYFVIYYGLTPALIVMNPDEIEKVLVNPKIEHKGIAYAFLRVWLGDGLLVSTGSKWLKRRKLLTPSFHFSILVRFLDVFNEQAHRFTEKISKMADGRTISIAPLVTLCSLDIICETIMGYKLQSQGGKNEEYVAAIHRFGYHYIERLRTWWWWSDFLFGLSSSGKDSAASVEILHDLTRKVIRERKLDRAGDDAIIDDQTQEVRKRRKLALLDLLIETQKRDETFTDEDIQEEVDTFMFGGHDTVATSTTFALHLIGRHPHVQEKIQKELDDVLDDLQGPISHENLGRLEYLNRTMKECQRMLSTVPFIARTVVEEFSTCGIMVPTGTSVMPNMIDLHRDPKYFPNPDVFDPDRFLPANSVGRHNFAYLPFSAGHRNCIGQKFAIMEQKVILATVLRKLKVRALQETDDLRLSSELVLRPVDGIDVQFEPRGKATN